MIAAEQITARLQAAGVRSVFAVAGASHARLLDALDRSGVALVSNRHESGAVGSADGYARTRRGLGVALIIAEQGLPNAIGGLASAWLANSPVLVLVATTPRGLVEPGAEVTDAWLSTVATCCKWCGMAASAADIDPCLQTAIAAANSARRGPAVLLIPADLLGEAVAPGEPVSFDSKAAAVPDPDAVERAAEVLEVARQPLILTGAGGWWSNAGDALRRLAALGFPVTGNGLGRGLVTEDWQSGFSWPLAQIAARQADAVLVAGSRLTQRQGFGLPPRFAAHARLVQVDVDARERHRSRPADIFIAADAATTLDALADLLEQRGIRAHNPGWLGKALSPRMQRLGEVLDRRADVIHPLQLGAAIAQRMNGSILVGDGADVQNWMYGVIAVRQAPGFMDHYPLGAMGSGTPLAVGAATAVRDGLAGNPGAVTVLITGDGSLGFHAAELHAAARAGLRLVVIVGNDGAWGTEVHEQRQAIGRELNTELGQLPYEKLAEAFGCRGMRVSLPGELEASLDEAFASEGPVLVNVLIDREAGAELKSDPLLCMIVFSDLAQGRRELGADS